MDVSRAVSRHLPGLFRREISQSMEVSAADARRSSCSLSVSGRSVGTGSRGFGIVGRQNMESSSRFCDDSHLRYYVGPKCHGGRLKKEKEAVKKKLKILKGLSSDLSAPYESSFLFRFDGGSVGEFQGDRFSVEETREALERQLQQLKTEEKEQKRKKKLEKAKLKAARVQIIHESSSSSSESSDDEFNMIATGYRVRKSLLQPLPDQWQTNTIQGSTLLLPTPLPSQPFPDQYQTNAIQGSTVLPPPLQTQQPSSDTQDVGVGVARSAPVGRVEVCMGNKCKKAGAAALMEEFERVMGADGVVCGCKCMGKCRDGPNVRVSSSFDMETRSGNPLCIGVGMEDVGRIVADYLGQEGQKQARFSPAI